MRFPKIFAAQSGRNFGGGHPECFQPDRRIVPRPDDHRAGLPSGKDASEIRQRARRLAGSRRTDGIHDPSGENPRQLSGTFLKVSGTFGELSETCESFRNFWERVGSSKNASIY